MEGLVSAYENILCGALSAVVLKEMKTAFESLWTALVMVKPPWTLNDVVSIIDKWVLIYASIHVDDTYIPYMSVC